MSIALCSYNGSSGTQYIALAQQEANTRKSFARGDSKKTAKLIGGKAVEIRQIIQINSRQIRNGERITEIFL